MIEHSFEDAAGLTNSMVARLLLHDGNEIPKKQNWEAILSEVSNIKQIRSSDKAAKELLAKTNTSVENMKTVRQVWHSLYRAVYGKRNKSSSKYWGMCIHYEWDFFACFYEWYVSQANWEVYDINNNLLKPGSRVFSPTTSMLISKDLDNTTLSKHILPSTKLEQNTYFRKLYAQLELTSNTKTLNGIYNLISFMNAQLEK